ncbi:MULTISPECIES: glycosyltransferase family 4 protein [Corynebacterium]|uniref:glycosyltransferase family 4 protein n=1 Tax=Corynebacterium TaxID=1716 RepID=UPI00210DE3B2|nr:MULTISPECIES: glycosyltransferase family 4 protein [Corynebacterium]MCQ4607796.1 glycosyltransferase family 4 protein [Corynebacterium pseudogenitalium]MCQ4611183.1 glycosyltransferase family 4 protein [Corynebacterium sp. CCUG 51687]UUA86415.1 glycosyltransferase family 4 protein [Corynebacterium pseudogenitalium]
MKIGIVCPYSFDEPGGVQAHILDLAESLLRQGHEVKVLGPARDDTPLPEFVKKGGRSLPIPYNGSVARLAFGPKVFTTTREFLCDGEFDVLHIHEPNSPSYSLAALMLASGPIVATYHTSTTGSRILQLALPFLRKYLEKIRGGIAVSELARRWQVEQIGADPIVIPNGVDTRKFVAARKLAPLSSVGPVRIAFLGRIDEPRKGLTLLLEAFDHLEGRVELTVIGSGEPRQIPGVNFVGRVSEEEKARLLGASDIFVAPNTGGESFGIILVEAMAAGCAVVASDLEAFSLVCDAESSDPAGILFPVGDVAELTKALQALIDDAALRLEMGRRGQLRAAQYDWSTVTAQIMAVYEAVSVGEKVTLA